ncbi:riboflavin synthase [Endozoicomonas sp. OPT23]|uniref:riboflavin synthase subunit alpha n=1 Tax=Endozoicomonas sp. OPT23 TaxID=2072845 RepID=UPI00129A8D8B|nr:riboflavin synthase subunit alpha [Endozoicomonas sp. OPT23]MRI34992.1 riboflavin synthase [Endozoicomonas sp. OPT23]
MFTGIVKGVFSVEALEFSEKFLRLSVHLNETLCEGLQVGASVAVNGVCLTVTSFTKEGLVTFDVMQETLRVTNLGELLEESDVNIERAARFNDEIGGHLLSGHIHDTVIVSDVTRTETNTTIHFEFDEQWSDYLLPKGYVALNGASLTIGEKVENNCFRVHLIPETLQMTTFGKVKQGDRVNLEIDSQTQAVVNTVKKYLSKTIR